MSGSIDNTLCRKETAFSIHHIDEAIREDKKASGFYLLEFIQGEKLIRPISAYEMSNTDRKLYLRKGGKRR